ncbi:hypothetical protein K8I85_12055, partial [bacterium]|nr:hypothetical protein [bacterium]
MRLTRVLRVLAATAAVALFRLPAPAAAAPPETFPLDDVRPGMTATFHTVMRDTTIEPFELELLSVVRDIGPDQDMILAKALGERIEHEGVSQGMSGSPVYLDGKLLGAVSSTWSFAKEPLVGITPVGQMMREAEKRGGPDGDNLSLICVRWGPETITDEPSTITETMGLGEFQT